MAKLNRRVLGILCWFVTLLLVAGCGGGGVKGSSPASAGGEKTLGGGATLTTIEVAPAMATLARGTKVQLAATGIYSDSSKQDLSAQVRWSSSDERVAAIGADGQAAATAAGSVTVSAALSGVTGSTTLTVTGATLTAIEVTPAQASIALGATTQLTATGLFSDSSKQDVTASVTWNSSSTGVATVSNANGLAGLTTPVAAGTSTITASSGGVVGSTTLTVTSATLTAIELVPANARIAKGATTQFIATALFSDNSKQDVTARATWSSTQAAVATVDGKGLATGTGPGTALIRADVGGISGSAELVVTGATLAALDIAPTAPAIPLGTSQQFAATATYSDNTTQDVTTQVTWNSSNAGVVRVGNSTGVYGQASAVGAGSATITATLGGLNASTTLAVTSAALVAIDVTPALPSIPTGFIQQFTATGIFADDSHSDITALVTWSSSNPGVATISNSSGTSGQASSAASGTATITATWGGLAGSSELTVTPAQLTSVDVYPSELETPLGLVQQFTASGNYDDGSTQDLTALATWGSSSTGVATVSNASGVAGLATPVAAGVTTITASYRGVAGSTTLTVTTATLTSIEVSPGSARIARGTTTPFAATGTYSDGTTQDLTTAVTWRSSAAAVATISNAGAMKGLAMGVSGGTATVTAQLGAVSGSATLTVTTATLTSISIDPANATLFLGVPEQYTATGRFSDGTSQDLSTLVTWKMFDNKLAMVSNAANCNGLVTPLRAGSTTISAFFMGVGGRTNLTVSAASLVSVAITPADQTLNIRKTLRLTATGTYSDGRTGDLTKAVTWRSTSKTIATITNNPSKRRGIVRALRPGTVTITAQMASAKGTTTITVK